MIALVAAMALSPGVYGLTNQNGRWWFLDPQGRPFWSYGVCCTGVGEATDKVKPDNPGYSGLQRYPSPDAWAKGTKRQLTGWGFNSLGGWSDEELFAKAAPMPYFHVLHLGAYDKAPWHDLFAPHMERAIDGAARDQIPKLRDDPNLVGYFTDNELGWWTDTLFLSYLEMPREAPGRRALMSLLRTRYRGNISRLRRDWVTSAQSFDDLDAKADLRLRPGGDGMQTVDAWSAALATRYYSMVRSAVRKYDARHLILGDRYCQYYDLPVARAAAPYVDAISANLGAEWIDGGLSRFFLDTLHRVTRKPIMVTEFYMTARENQSGNRNSSSGFPIVQTQAQRAAAYGRNVAELAARPYVIGAHWFQFYDEPPKGRGDGEDYNMGLVDVYGKPYAELTGVSARLHPAQRHERAAEAPIANTAPRAPKDAGAGLLHWDRARSLIAPSWGTPFADLYASWTPDALYVGLFAMDFIEERLYPQGRLPESERPTWTVWTPGMDRRVTVRYGGAKRKVAVDVPGIEATELPGLKHTVILRIPKRLIQGRRLRIEARLESHGRAERMSWSREVRLIP